MNRALLVLVSAVACLFLGGCGMTSGNEMSPDAVGQIQKGVTTKAEIEAKFGVPIGTGLGQDGRRYASYVYVEAKNDPITYVPYVNLFASGQTARRQTLQVVYRDNVVEDFEYFDTTAKASGGALKPHIQESVTPVANSK